MSDFLEGLSTLISLIITIVPFTAQIIIYSAMDERDIVNLKKGQQVLSYLAKLAVFFLIFWGLFFYEAIMLVQKKPDYPLPDSFFILTCVLFAISELVLMGGYAVFSRHCHALTAMQNKKGLNLAQNCCIICLLVVLMFLACLEYATIVLALKDNSQDLIKIISFTFVMALLYMLNIYFAFESLKLVENKRWYTIDDDNKKLYLCYRIDDNQMMCEYHENSAKTSYILLSKEYIEGRFIHVESSADRDCTHEGNPTNDRTTDVTLEKAEQTTDQSSRTEYVYRHSLQSKEGEATEETYAKYASMKQSRRR